MTTATTNEKEVGPAAPQEENAGEEDFAVTGGDSLTLMQLKRLVAHVARPKQPQYEFKYEDTDSLQNEIDEWFDMDEEILEKWRLRMESTFDGSWMKATNDKKKEYITHCLLACESSNHTNRISALEGIAYVALGVWKVSRSVEHQLYLITENVKLLRACNGLDYVYGALRHAWHDKADEDMYPSLTILYLMMEVSRSDASFRAEVVDLEPPIIPYLIRKIGGLRFVEIDSYHRQRMRNVFVLLWKCILCCLGGTRELEDAKEYVRMRGGVGAPQGRHNTDGKDEIYSSPLDYQAFCQDFVAKYPAYKPPDPHLAIDANEVLSMAQTESQAGMMDVMIGPPGGSATPAPSPPPSPQLKMRKLSFQTNNNMPFLYPTDAEAVPTSVSEAVELFSDRLRTSVGVRQLWQERERFMRFQRGWSEEDKDLSNVTNMGKLNLRETMKDERDVVTNGDEAPQAKLQQVEETYQGMLADLQSCLIVLLKVLLATLNDDTNDRRKDVIFKAVSAILILLLKWCKVSHVLKFEYVCQMLLDSNFLLLSLKIFGGDIAASVAYDKDSLPFFSFCHPSSATSNGNTSSSDSEPPPPGMMYSWRNFFWAINFARVLQKICKHKPHRNMQMAGYKSAGILKRLVKIPQEDLRLYVLKLIKSQVAYCGRKWRQGQTDSGVEANFLGNMKIITSIYLTCRPTLRDDWLGVGDDLTAGPNGVGVGAGNATLEEMEREAANAEYALRTLTLYYHTRQYPQQMRQLGHAPSVMKDFFSRQTCQ